MHALQALSMREVRDIVKIQRKQTFSGLEREDVPFGQQVLRLFHNKTLPMGCIPEIAGYCMSIVISQRSEERSR